jgi:hypothetical protein
MLSDLRGKIEVLFEQLTAEGYPGHQEHVRDLIARCRITLARGTGQLGPWEGQELAYADAAITASFLRIALVAADKALKVSQLSYEEYDYGFHYATRRET